MKKRLINTLAVLLILALSVGIGFVYSRYDIEKKKKEYPRSYQADVTALSYTYSVPVSVIYASVKVRSDFDPAKRTDDGKTGLLQLTAEQYYRFEDELGGRASDPGLLYEPATNLRLGICWISGLFAKYGSWDTVYAAMYAGEETVDGWIGDDEQTDGDETRRSLSSVPDGETSEYVKLMKKTVKIYSELYESAGILN